MYYPMFNQIVKIDCHKDVCYKPVNKNAGNPQRSSTQYKHARTRFVMVKR
jgi:hypothetical protein